MSTVRGTSRIIKKKKEEMWQIDITRQLPEDKFEFLGDAIDQGRINGKRLVIDKSV